MNEKEEKTVKPKSDVSYDYYKTRFEAENEIKEGFYQKTNFLIIAMSLVASFALYFLNAYFVWSFWGLVCCSLVVAGAILFIKGFWHVFRMMYDCGMQQMTDTKDVRDYEKSSSAVEFEELLCDRLATCASFNRATNLRRGKHFYKAGMSLLFSFVFFALYAIVGFTMRLDEKDKPQPMPLPPIEKEGSNKGSR